MKTQVPTILKSFQIPLHPKTIWLVMVTIGGMHWKANGLSSLSSADRIVRDTDAPKHMTFSTVAARRCAFFLMVFGNACPKRKAAAQETAPSAPHIHSGGPSVSARSEAGTKYPSRTENAMAVAI